jgi:hypothetical protein
MKSIEFTIITACKDLRVFSNECEIPYRCVKVEHCPHKLYIAKDCYCVNYTIMKRETLNEFGGGD